MLPVLHRWVHSVTADGCHGGRDVWSVTNLVTVGNSDVEQVGECRYDATNVLKTIIKAYFCSHQTGSKIAIISIVRRLQQLLDCTML